MNADIKGCLAKINKIWPMFEHNGQSLTKLQVTKILEYGRDKGYSSTNQITDTEIDQVLKSL